MFENETHIVLRHYSHAEYCGRWVGSKTCESYAKLHTKEEIAQQRLHNGHGGIFMPWVKEWRGRINPKRVLADCKDLGVEFE